MAATNVQAFSGDVEISSNLAVNTDDLFVDTVNSRVGIGTTNPIRPLELAFDGAGSIINIKRTDSGGTQGAIAFSNYLSNVCASIVGERSGVEGGELRFFTVPNDTSQTSNNPYSINERMRIDKDGNVGIGTATPGQKLSIYTGSTSTPALSFDRFSSDDYRTDIYQNTYGPDFRVGYGTHAPSSVLYLKRLSDGSKEVEVDGKVGFGTDDPKALFHIGNILATNTTATNEVPTSNFGNSSDFPVTTHAWFGNRVGADGEDYWGLAIGTIYAGGSYLQNLNKGNANYYDLMLQPSGGNVGIGLTNPFTKFVIGGTGCPFAVDTSIAAGFCLMGNQSSSNNTLVVGSLGNVVIACDTNANSSNKSIEFRTNTSTNAGTLIAHMRDNGRIGIRTVSPEALMHFKSTAEYATNSGIRLERYTNSWYWEIHTWGEDLYFSHNNTGKAWVDRDGSNGVKLNFTGQHRTFVEDLPYSGAESKKGLIVSADKNQYIKMSGGVAAGSNAITINESLPIVSLSNVANDKKCFGVISDAEDPDKRIVEAGHFKSLDTKEDGDTRIFINSVGEGAIWVADINGFLESGDYITTSNIAGYGMKQDDDILHNYTVAKITMDCDFNPSTQPVKRVVKELKDIQYWIKTNYSDITYAEYSNLAPENQHIELETYYLNENGEISVETYENMTSEEKNKYTEMSRTKYQSVSTVEYKTDPNIEDATLEVRQEYVNVLDENRQLMWEEHPTDTEKAYKIRYLDANGIETDEANYVYKAAFVGCTYHCG